MRKVGATTSGSVIVEMNVAQFEALSQFMDPKPVAVTDPKKQDYQEVKAMAVKRKLDNIRACVKKLKPDNRDSMVQLIRSAHSFSGSYAEKEIDHLFQILAREKLFTVGDGGSIEYPAPFNEAREEAVG